MTRATRRCVSLATIAFLLPVAVLPTGLARRVADLNPGTWTESWGEICTEMAPGLHVDGWPGYLFADLRDEGCEVFAVDAVQGTVTWRSGLGEVGARVSRLLGSAGGLVYLEAETRAAGPELWRTDGTAAGTFMLPEGAPGAGWNSSLGWFVPGVPWSYFRRSELGSGRELWRTDGTAAGTGRVLDLRPGPESGVLDGPPGVATNGLVFFVGDDGVHGAELWRSDGSSAGTFAVTDLNRETKIRHLASLGSRALLTTFDGRLHLWSSDGTVDGTHRIWSSAAGATLSSSPVTNGARALFAVDEREIWVSDGTATGTEKIAEISTVPSYRNDPRPLAGGWLFFAADATHGLEPWITDGTAAGTRMILDLEPGWGNSMPMHPLPVSARLGTGLLLTLQDSENGAQLWFTEGTAASTVRLTDVEATEAAGIRLLGDASGVGLFAAGGALWRTDGTPTGTQPWITVVRERSPSGPRRLFDAGELLYFVAIPEAHESRAGRTDGTEAGTGFLDGQLHAWNSYFSRLEDGTLIANTDRGEDSLFWSSTGDGILALTTYWEGCGGHQTCGWDRALPTTGPLALYPEAGELGATDGTPIGTGLWLDLRPGPEVSFPRAFVQAGSEAWFAASTGAGGTDQVWRSAGTPGTTTPFLDLPADPSGTMRVRQLLPLDPAAGRLLLRRSVYPEPDELWYGGGFGATPVLLLDDIDAVEALGVVGDRMLLRFWGAPNSGVGFEPWVSDGTVAGTTLLADVWPGVVGSDPRPGVEVSGRLVFSACDPDHGCEPWVSDGTPAGTTLLADLQPGPGSSSPAGFARIGAHAYFSACRTGSGCEAWTTDGTAAGTFELATIDRGAATTLPRGEYYLVDGDADGPAFVEHAGEIYFAGDDGTGAELWAMPVLLFYDGFQTGDTSRWSAP
jgi:ELWxxDGT repeat protein